MPYASNIDVGVQLRFLDDLTHRVQAPIAAMNRLRQSIGSAAAEATRSTGAMARLAAAYEGLSSRAERAHRRMSALRGRAIGVAASAFALGVPLYRAAEYELGLTRFGQIAQWTGPELRRNILGVNDALRQVSVTTGTSTRELVGAASTIMGIVGRAFETDGVFDVNRMRTTMEAVARWATAAGVGLDEAARATAVLFQNAGLSANALERAFNIVTQAGKIGGFEAPDSARWFPGMLASYGTMFATHIRENTAGMTPEQRQQFQDQLGLGMVANLSAFLQMARLGAADASIAGNNLVNVIQKMFVPETARNFRKVLGVDFMQLMTNAVNRGDDPIFEVIKQVAGLVQRRGSTFAVGLTFADRQALEGLLPLVNMYLNNRSEFQRILREVRQAGDPNRPSVISQDLASTLITTILSFRMLRHRISDFWSEVLLAGGGSSLSTAFMALTGALRRLNDLIAGNRGFAGSIIRMGFVAAGALGGLVLLRFALAGLSLMFARTGMAAISFLSIIPGLGAVLNAGGLVGGVLGSLLRLGLIGGAGFLAYQNWDLIKGVWDLLFGDTSAIGYENWLMFSAVWEQIVAVFERARGAVGGFFERLGVLFPGLYPALSDFFGQFRLWTGDVGRLVEVLRRLGSDLFETLSFLFGGGGDPAAFQRFQAGFGELTGHLGQGVPLFQSLGEWWGKFSSRLMFHEGIGAGLGAWGKGLATLFGVFSGWAVATHGANGLLLILMALRSAMFVLGTIVGFLQIVALVLATLIAPIIESLLDLPLIRRLLLGAGIGLGVVGLIWYQLGWEGVKSIFSGFFAGFADATRSARTRLSAAWNRLMVQIFGDDSGPDAMNRLFLSAMEWGKFIGSYAASGIKELADAIDYLATALDGFSERHPVLSSAAGWMLGLLGSAAALGIVLSILQRIGKFLLAISMIPTLLRTAVPAIAAISGGLVAFLASMGPAGWIILGILGLAAAIALVVYNFDWLMEKFQQIWDFAADFLANAIDSIIQPFRQLAAWLSTNIVDPIANAFRQVGDWISNTVGAAINFVLEKAQQLLETLRAISRWFAGRAQAAAPGEEIPTLGGPRPPRPWETEGGWLSHIERGGLNIGGAGEEAATGIRDAGGRTAGALNDVAAALAAAAARLANIAGSAGPVRSSLDGALNDAPRPGVFSTPHD